MNDARVDVFLLGFRNDLSRERVLAAAARGHLGGGPDILRLDRNTPLPHLVGSGVSAARAAELRAEIEHLGGQVSIRSTEGSDETPIDLAPARRSPSFAVLSAVLIAAAAVAYFIHQRRSPTFPRALPNEIASRMQPDLSDDNTDPASDLNREAVALGNAGHYAEAVAKLRQALGVVPNRPLLRHNLQVILTNWGASQLHAGELNAAIDHFNEALGYGSHPEILTGLGIAEFRAQNYPMAERYLQQALDGGAPKEVILPALGEAYEKNGDRVHALETLQRAQEAGVRLPGLRDRIERLSREVDAEWGFRADESRHFDIRFSEGESPYAARIVLRSLESAYDVVGRKFGIYPEQRTAVVLYPEKEFHNITETPEWAGAAFDGRIKLPVGGLTSDDAALDRMVRHEYAHSLISSLGDTDVPTWLNEGLAMWAEEESPGDRIDAARQRLAGRPLLPFAQMTAPFVTLPADRVEAAYAQSYLTVWYMINHYGERRLPELLDALRKEHRFATAYADVYPGDLSALERQVADELSG